MSTEKPITDLALEVKQSQERLDLAEKGAENRSELNAQQQHRVSGYTEERDLMNQLLGQVQMSRSIAKFADVVSLSKAGHIKKNKLYQALKGMSATAPDGTEIADVGNWAGFCQLVGSSVSKMDEDLRNLEYFGEQALAQLNSVGAGYRELRRLRKLPAEDREALLQVDALESGDVEELRERIEQLESQLSSSATATEGLKKDLAAKQAVLESKAQHISKLEHDLAARETMPPDEQATELGERLEKHLNSAIGAMLAPANACKAIFDWEDAPEHLRNKAFGSFARLRANLDDLAEKVGVPVYVGEEPAAACEPWMSDSEDLQA